MEECACRHEEAKQVAALQASAFYEPLAFAGPLNKILQLGFEVLHLKSFFFWKNDVLVQQRFCIGL